MTDSAATVLDAALPLLQCPHCHGAVYRVLPAAVGCGNGHRFDVARQGYLSLLGSRSRTDTGDTADMVAARAAFLGADHYRPVAQAVASMVARGPVLEIGAGTGYYLSAVLDRLAGTGERPLGIALDASRYAARRAAANPATASIVADAWSRLPVMDRGVGAVLSVFAPRDPAEIARVLTPGGRLVVVTPEPEHLTEIRSTLGLLAVDPGKPDRLVEAFSGHLAIVDRGQVHREMRLGPEDVSALVRMGPSARHVQADALSVAVAALPDITSVTLSVTISVFERPADLRVSSSGIGIGRLIPGGEPPPS